MQSGGSRRRHIAYAVLAAPLLALAAGTWLALGRMTGASVVPSPRRYVASTAEQNVREAGEREPGEPLDANRAPAPSAASDTHASTEDLTLLRVSIVDPAGTRATEGLLECYAGPRSFPETNDDGLRLSVPVRAETTEVILPADCTEALLVAHASIGPTTLWRVEDLRGAGPEFRVSGFVERDVEIVLVRDPSVPVAQGTIWVDGERRVPAGLKILLHHDDGEGTATMEELLLRQPKLATVDIGEAAYAVGPLTESAAALWVTSESTAPCWVPLPFPRSPEGISLDLHCATGSTLHLACVDDRSGLPVPGARIETETLVATSTTERKISFRTFTTSRTADRNGECVIRGLPAGGIFRVTSPSSAESSRELAPAGIRLGGAILLELRLDPELSSDLWREVRIPGAREDVARVWGRVADLVAVARSRAADERAPLEVCFAPLRSQREESAVRRASIGTVAWEARVPGPDDVAFWVEREGRRVSEVVELWIAGNRETGPVSFAPRNTCPASFRWTDAPVGGRAVLALLSARGVETLADWAFADPRGELELELDAGGSLNLTLSGSGGDEVQRQFDWNPARRPILEVDLCGSRARLIRLEIPSETRSRDGEIVLFGSHDRAGESPVRVVAELRDGVTRAALAVPPGEYFYRLLGAEDACVLGSMRIVETHGTQPLEVVFEGRRRRLDDVELEASASLIVESVGDEDLSAWVPPALRTFSLQQGEASQDGRFLCPDAFTYRVYRR